MKVLCTRVPVPVDGMVLDSSPWVTVGREYIVLEILAVFRGRVSLRLVTDDARSLGLFSADCFVTVDSAIPSNWVARVREGGLLELAPDAWLVDGFWDRYYDQDPNARASVDYEIAISSGIASA